jgi:RND family efflux transporter MFP subunit
VRPASKRLGWKWWAAGGLVVGGLVPGVILALGHAAPAAQAPPGPAAENGAAEAPQEPVRVEVLQPHKEAMERTTVQPGSVQAYESVQLYAGVSGYLRVQAVDIGDRVKRGQVLATVAVPDLEKQVARARAAVARDVARVNQMKARVVSARADLEAAKAGVVQAEAAAKGKAAERRFREQQLTRMKDLFALKSIDERLVDEKTEQRDAAVEAAHAAVAAVATARAQFAAAQAKIDQAEADVVEAQAEVEVSQAELEKAQVMVQFATVTAPFDGVVAQRNYFPGDYVRGAAEGGSHHPLLTVQRTDRMRVVVQIPDRDVPYADPGDAAVVEIDALPGERFPAKVSRIAQSEDAATRLMHVEIDLPNPEGKIRNGMYGRVTVLLEKRDLLAIPSSCLAGKIQDGKSSVLVVRDGRARRVPVRVGADDGRQIGILTGLRADDRVIRHPGGDVEDGTAVVVAETPPPEPLP